MAGCSRVENSLQGQQKEFAPDSVHPLIQSKEQHSCRKCWEDQHSQMPLFLSNAMKANLQCINQVQFNLRLTSAKVWHTPSVHSC